MKKNKIDVHTGWGSFKDKGTITVSPSEASDFKDAYDITGKQIIIATGSAVASLPGVDFDGKRILSSTEALELEEVPKHLIVIGGGYIGLEMGSVWARLGSEVTVLEYASSLIPAMDAELGKEAQKVFKKQLGFAFHFNHKVQSATVKGKTVTVKALDKDDKEVEFKGDYVLASVGRKPFTDKLGLDKVGVEVDERGRVKTNEELQTNIAGIWAIGDVVAGAMLAHKASEEGVAVAERIAGQKPHINYRAIPGVVYTWPEIAGVGYTTEELKSEGIPFKVGKFPFMASGRARAADDTDGFIKVLAHKETDEVLGVHMIGPRVADIIGMAVHAIEFRASAEDMGIISYAHPTFSESLKEAALAATDNRARNM